MPSLIQGYEYDVFISYRQNDNRSGWVSQFVEDLREELAATIKEPVSIYFDENPHDGLQDTHHVDKSLERKLKCVVFIPILSRTYCDPKSYAWNQEFLAFRQASMQDQLGPHLALSTGNFASRILPIQIHELDVHDQHLFESSIEDVLRSVDFVFRSQGVNRPLTPLDQRSENVERLVYRDQVNKTANALAEIFLTLTTVQAPGSAPSQQVLPNREGKKSVTGLVSELRRRSIHRAGIVYIGLTLLGYALVTKYIPDSDRFTPLLGVLSITGLFIALLLAWLYERSPKGWIRTTSPESFTNPYRSYQKKPLTSVWVMLALASLVLYYFLQDYKEEGKSIAVLPFENRSPNPADTYLSDGFSEDIVSRLYMLGDFQVISTASSRAYKNSDKTIKQISEELDVSSILTGSIQRSGSFLKVTVQLHEGSTSALIWSQVYERGSSDIMLVQSEIARQIAATLSIRIDDYIVAKLDRVPTRSLSAYDHLLKGRNLYNYSNSDSMDLAIDQFKKAILLDPNYAQAHAGLADAYVQLHARFARGAQWIDSAIVVAQQAVELDSGLSDGYKALGAAHSYARRYDTAFYYLKRAVKMNQNNAQAIGNLGQVYFIKLNYPEALRHYKKSSRLNPKNPVPYQAMGWTYRLIGDFPRAEYYLQKSLEYRPLWDTYRELAFVYLAQGRSQEAIALIDKILELGNRGTRPLEIAGRIAHFAGEVDMARVYFKEALQKNPNYQNDPNSLSAIALGQILLQQGNHIESEFYLSRALELFVGEIKRGVEDDDPPFNIAAIHAIQNNRSEALKYLTMAVEMRWIDYIQVEKGPYFALFRDDPDFKTIVEAVKEKASSIRDETVRSTAMADAAPL